MRWRTRCAGVPSDGQIVAEVSAISVDRKVQVNLFRINSLVENTDKARDDTQAVRGFCRISRKGAC